jgi:hypothetical protein
MTNEQLLALCLGSLLLTGPYVWEVDNDGRGDFNKRRDIRIRGGLMGLVSLINALLNVRNNLAQSLYFFALSFNASLAWFFMFFDYSIAWILIRNKVVETRISWFDYLGKVGSVDNWAPWRNLTQRQRFLIRLVYFLASIAIYTWYVIKHY